MTAIEGARTKGAWRPAFGWTTFDMATSLFSFNEGRVFNPAEQTAKPSALAAAR